MALEPDNHFKVLLNFLSGVLHKHVSSQTHVHFMCVPTLQFHTCSTVPFIYDSCLAPPYSCLLFSLQFSLQFVHPKKYCYSHTSFVLCILLWIYDCMYAWWDFIQYQWHLVLERSREALIISHICITALAISKKNSWLFKAFFCQDKS